MYHLTKIPNKVFIVQTNTLTPTDTLILDCENWYALECKRLKECHAAGQEREFSFAEALQESYFTDVIIKSSDGFDVGKFPADTFKLRFYFVWF